MATWQDLLEKGALVLGGGVEAYTLMRQQRSEEKIAKERAAVEAAKAEAELLTAQANRDTIAKFGQWAIIAAGAMLALTLLAQVRRMWKAK